LLIRRSFSYRLWQFPEDIVAKSRKQLFIFFIGLFGLLACWPSWAKAFWAESRVSVDRIKARKTNEMAAIKILLKMIFAAFFICISFLCFLEFLWQKLEGIISSLPLPCQPDRRDSDKEAHFSLNPSKKKT
jgi:hypothetical protein